MAEFVIWPHAVLGHRAQFRPVDAAMVEVGETLRAAAEGVQAYGLAAAHIGKVEPLVVLSVADAGEARDYRVLYNPEIVSTAEEISFGAEGSVSMPGIEAPIARPVWAEIGYDDAQGQRQTARFEGFVARVALHEIEQMNGVFFLARLSRLKRDTAIRKFEKSQRT